MSAKLSINLLGRPRPIDWLLSPIQEFFRVEAAGGILLMACTVAALVWANSPWSESYHNFWNTYFSFEIGSFVKEETLGHWVNDGLMVIFFFVVGLEIKREMLVGELSSMRKAAIPIAAAVGGMVVPAVIYAGLNFGTEAASGWAVPCATDIAFALGVLAMLGKRVPVTLKILITAAAIVDDIGAVLIIAVFYTKEISGTALAIAGGTLVLLIIANRLHVRHVAVFVLLGAILWLTVLVSGVHATIAGVLLAFTIPARQRIPGRQFIEFSRRALDDFEQASGDQDDIMTNHPSQRALHGLETACEQVQSPLIRLEHGLHPWSSFLIIPIFALANAGVTVGGGLGAALSSRIGLGVILGLVLGKQIGITLFAWLAVKLGIGDLPDGVTWKRLYAASWLAGIGFTMSMFIAYLGFESPDNVATAKLSVLAGSLVAGVVGYVLLRRATRPGGD